MAASPTSIADPMSSALDTPSMNSTARKRARSAVPDTDETSGAPIFVPEDDGGEVTLFFKRAGELKKLLGTCKSLEPNTDVQVVIVAHVYETNASRGVCGGRLVILTDNKLNYMCLQAVGNAYGAVIRHALDNARSSESETPYVAVLAQTVKAKALRATETIVSANDILNLRFRSTRNDLPGLPETSPCMEILSTEPGTGEKTRAFFPLVTSGMHASIDDVPMPMTYALDLSNSVLRRMLNKCLMFGTIIQLRIFTRTKVLPSGGEACMRTLRLSGKGTEGGLDVDVSFISHQSYVNTVEDGHPTKRVTRVWEMVTGARTKDFDHIEPITRCHIAFNGTALLTVAQNVEQSRQVNLLIPQNVGGICANFPLTTNGNFANTTGAQIMVALTGEGDDFIPDSDIVPEFSENDALNDFHGRAQEVGVDGLLGDAGTDFDCYCPLDEDLPTTSDSVLGNPDSIDP